MSREQLTEQQAGTESSAATAEKDDAYGLPPALHAQVMRLGPGDSDALGNLLTLFPIFSRGILSLASQHVGSIAVQRAIKIQEQRAATRVAAPGNFDQEDFRKSNDEMDAADAAKRARGEVRPPGNFDKEEFRQWNDQQDEADGSKRARGEVRPPGDFDKDEFRQWNDQQDEADGSKQARGEVRPPGDFDKDEFRQWNDQQDAQDVWVEGARRYNEQHPALVDEFNELTGYSCLYRTGSGGLDPKAVRRWQAEHGLEADGKVGPATVAAARKESTKASAPAAPQTDVRPPV